MKKFFFSILLILSLISCENPETLPGILHNQKCILRNKWISHTRHYFLISLPEDSTMVREMEVNYEKFWKRSIGDTLTYQYISADKFFKSNGKYDLQVK